MSHSLDTIDFTRKTPLTHLPDTIRVVLGISALLATASLSQLATLSIALAFAIALLPIGEMPLTVVLRRLMVAELFVLALVGTLPFLMPGRPVLTIGPITATVEGITSAMAVVLRISAAILLVVTLLAPLGTTRLGQALADLRFPTRLVSLLVLIVRYTGLFRHEFDRLIRAKRARAFQPTASIHTLRSYGYLIGMSVLNATHRAERIGWAMRARGFSGAVVQRSPLRWTLANTALAFFVCATLAALIAMDRAT